MSTPVETITDFLKNIPFTPDDVIKIALIVLIYYLCIWFFIAKNRDFKRIAATPEPPALSPASVRYIKQMGYDDKTYTTAIISMAAKKFLEITYDEKYFTLKQLINDGSMLTEEEMLVANNLFDAKLTMIAGNVLADPTKTTLHSFTVNQTNRSIFRNTSLDLKKYFKTQYQEVYFNINYLWHVLPVMLTCLAYITAIGTAANPAQASEPILVILLIIYVMYFLIQQLSFKFRIKPVNDTLSIIMFVGIALFICDLWYVLLTHWNGTIVNMPNFTLPTLFFISIVDLAFFQLLKTPTAQGKKILNECEAFKLSINYADSYSTDYYENYLPYAIALNLEKKWGEKLYQSLKRTSTNTKNYSLPYYSRQGENVTAATLPVALSGDLTKTIFFLCYRRKGDWR